MWQLLGDSWDWVVAQAESALVWLPVSALILILGKFASTYVMELLRERRARINDHRKAASEFVYVADSFRRYWVRRFYSDKNQQPDPDPDSSVEWSGDAFEPLLTSERHPLYSRLSENLKNCAYALDHRVREAKESIATLSEYDEDQIDIDAPIHVCEIAIAADQFWKAVLKEAGLTPPPMYDAISDIESDLREHLQDKQRAAEERQRFNDEFFKSHAVKKD